MERNECHLVSSNIERVVGGIQALGLAPLERCSAERGFWGFGAVWVMVVWLGSLGAEGVGDQWRFQ